MFDESRQEKISQDGKLKFIEAKMFITLALVRSDMVLDQAPEEPDALQVTQVNEIR